MKIRPVVAEVPPCGQTDMTKLIVAFRSFTNSPKNNQISLQYRRTYLSDLNNSKQNTKKLLEFCRVLMISHL